MKFRNYKNKAITKMLTLLGFSSVAFVFTACYGTMPNDYDENIADSLSVAFSRGEVVQTDSVQATQSAATDVSDKTADVR